VKINKILFFFLSIIIILLPPAYGRLEKSSADKVNHLLKSILTKKIQAKKIIMTEDEINSYLYYYRKKIFTDDVKWAKVKLKNNNLIEIRVVMFFNGNTVKDSYLSLLKGSIIDINSRFKLKNLNSGCFQIKLLSLNVNGLKLDNQFAINLISTISPDFKKYFEGFCPDYKIRKIMVREEKIIFLF